MDYLWEIHQGYSWMGLIALMIKLGIFYFVLRLARNSWYRIKAPSFWQHNTQLSIHYLLLVFEPLAILLLLSYLVLIHPFNHGLILIVLLLAGLKHLRSYISGRVVLFDSSFRVGSQIKTPTLKGVISHIGRLGIRVQSDKSQHYISYNQLQQEVYSLFDTVEKGGFYTLKILANDGNTDSKSLQEFQHLLNISPYINWQHKPQLKTQIEAGKTYWLTQLSLHQEHHLSDFISLLEERDYSCQIAKF